MSDQNFSGGGRSMKINNIFIIIFLLVGLIPALVVGGISVWSSTNLLKTSGQEHVNGIAGLEAIADLKVDKIETLFNEIESDLIVVRDHQSIKENVPILTQFTNDQTNPQYIDAKEETDRELMSWHKTRGEVEDIIIWDLDEKIVYLSEESEYLDLGIKFHHDLGSEFFEKSKKNVSFSKIFIESKEDHKEFEMLATSPIYDSNEDLIGILGFEIDIGFVYDFIQDTTGLGETGETLIGRYMESHPGETVYGHFTSREGDHALFLNPLRHDPNAAFNREAFFGDPEAIPMQEAVQGKEGSGISIDYRGEKVIAAWRYLPIMDWGLVAKIDVGEAFAPIEKIKSEILVLLIFSALFSIFLAIIFARKISKPIKNLTNRIDEITKGNLDIQLGKSNIYEHQGLIDSLNRILASLKLAILKVGIKKSELGLGKALKEVENKYKILYDTSADAIMTLVPPKWNFTAGNPATIKMFRVKDEKDFTSRAPWQYSPKKQPDGKESKAKAKEMIMKAMKEGANFFEWTHKRLNGEEFPASVLLTKVKEGGKEYLQATVRDLTRGTKPFKKNIETPSKTQTKEVKAIVKRAADVAKEAITKPAVKKPEIEEKPVEKKESTSINQKIGKVLGKKKVEAKKQASERDDVLDKLKDASKKKEDKYFLKK